MTGAERIADFVQSLRGFALPVEVADAARLHFLDAIGVGLAASSVAHSARWRDAAGPPGPATLLGGGTAAPEMAAMVNGALIHSLEYDDTHIASVVHGSAFAAPMALAGAEAAGADGDAMLRAYVAAWEVAIRLGRAAPGAFQARGVQVTAAAGAIGAAAGAALVAGLDRRATVHALGIAGSEASGLLAFLSDGTSVKALHPGWAAHSGLLAARLAGAGMTGPAAILEDRFGVMPAFAGTTGSLEEELATLGKDWFLPESAFKLYPACHYIHPFLEALETLVEGGLTADRLQSLTAHVPPPEAPLIAEPWERRQTPSSGYDGKWGLAYCLALRLADGRLDIDSFTREPRAEVTALARRMAWQPMEDHGFPARFAARIKAVTSDGAAHTAEVPNVLGAPDRPVPADRIVAKFRENAGRILPQARSTALEAAILAGHRPEPGLFGP